MQYGGESKRESSKRSAHAAALCGSPFIQLQVCSGAYIKEVGFRVRAHHSVTTNYYTLLAKIRNKILLKEPTAFILHEPIHAKSTIFLFSKKSLHATTFKASSAPSFPYIKEIALIIFLHWNTHAIKLLCII